MAEENDSWVRRRFDCEEIIRSLTWADISVALSNALEDFVNIYENQYGEERRQVLNHGPGDGYSYRAAITKGLEKKVSNLDVTYALTKTGGAHVDVEWRGDWEMPKQRFDVCCADGEVVITNKAGVAISPAHVSKEILEDALFGS